MINLILFLILVFSTFYLAMIYGSTALALLGFAEAVFLVLAYGYLLFVRHFLTISLKVPIQMMQQEEELPFQIQYSDLVSPAQLRSYMKLRSSFQKRCFRKKLKLCQESHIPDLSSFHLALQGAGRYDLTLSKVRIYDITGLLCLTKKIGQSASIDVLPRFCPLPIHLTEPVLHFLGDADVYDNVTPGQDVSETLQYRPFQPGDRIQSIHWKLSARCDELMVKENSQPKACPVALLMTFSDAAYLQAAASITFSIMDSGCPLYVSWYSSREQDVVRLRVDDEESLYTYLLCYLEDRPSPGTRPDIQTAYQEKYQSEPLLHTLYLNEQLALYQNGHQLLQLDPAHLEKSIVAKEVIL